MKKIFTQSLRPYNHPGFSIPYIKNTNLDGLYIKKTNEDEFYEV
jgi:hypothetical protein